MKTYHTNLLHNNYLLRIFLNNQISTNSLISKTSRCANILHAIHIVCNKYNKIPFNYEISDTSYITKTT